MTLAGLARAREEGTKLGRKRLEHTNAARVAPIGAMHSKARAFRRIARQLGVGVGTIMRIIGTCAGAGHG
jgi:DNA invertase Pin-like site-specific DNA recombinase